MSATAIRPGSASKRKRYLLAAAAALLVVLVVAAVIAHHYWPLTDSAVRKDLGSAAAADVHFASFHTKYFPPGCVAENVVFQRPGSDHALITIKRLTIRVYPSAMLNRHVSLIRAEGMHVILERSDFAAGSSGGNQRTIDRLVADDAVLEISHQPPQASTRFVFHKFLIKNLGGAGTMQFAAIFDNPMPQGLIRTSGEFGPWNRATPQQVPVSGKYQLENADLSVFDGIAGTLSSEGAFSGPVAQINVNGSTSSKDFTVQKTGHALPLNTQFSATVNATNGDVFLHEVKARFGRNEIEAHGSVARGDDQKRAAIIDLQCKSGRIEDAFYPFIHSPKSPLTGDVAFTMKATVPAGSDPFLKKLTLQSNFQIQNSRFTHQQTQERLNKIAEDPHQKEPNETVADFQGTVTLTNGVAHFSSLSVHDQGAAARFHGSFGLINQRVNMSGDLKTATSLTKTTSGISAAFAKVLEPFFKKKPHDTVVPVRIGGTYSHPSFGLNM